MDAAARNLTLVTCSESHPTLLFVDDEPSILSALKRVFRASGCRVVVAESGAEGLEILGRESVNLILSDMRMPQMSGARFLSEVAERWPGTIRILLTGFADIESTVAAINDAGIYRYIAKPWEDNDLRLTVERALEQQSLEAEQARLEALIRTQNQELKALNESLEQKVDARTADLQKAARLLKQTNENLKRSYHDTIEVLAQLIKLREGHSTDHARLVAEHARATGGLLGLDTESLENIYLAALLHDIGEIGLSDEIVHAPHNKLTSHQRRRMREHPAIGSAALMSLPPLEEVAQIVRSHHELYDGSGYPDGLSGERILLGARIIVVADEFDNLLTGQLNGHKSTREEACDYLRKKCSKRYDPFVVEAFLTALEREDEVQLKISERKVSSGELHEGMVLTRNLCSRNGIVLICKGKSLTNRLIEKICIIEKDGDKPFEFFIDKWLAQPPGRGGR